MCKNVVEPDRPLMTVWRMRIACWIRKATNTHSGYVIIFAFPLQQWLHERPHRYFTRTLPVSIHSSCPGQFNRTRPLFWLLVDWCFGIQGYCSSQRPHIIGTFKAVHGNIQFAKLVWKHSSELACICIRQFWMFWAVFPSWLYIELL